MAFLDAIRAKPESATRLPARVTRAIHAQRERSEILTGWVQAALIAILASLFFLAPSTSPDNAAVRLVPTVIGLYGLFTALRLWLAYTGRLSTWMRGASVLIDMALLTTTIWSFHVEYGQPAAFYLKAPTFAYFFIFIALRTLSFSPGFVLLAGASAAGGWLVLLFYALYEPGGMELVTRDYIDYMTAAKILIGGEVDKIVSLLLVAALLAIAVSRSQKLLEHAAADQAATAQLVRYFPAEVAQQLIAADELLVPGQGESRDAAIMFIDLRGFTRLAAHLSPTDLLALIGDFQRTAVPIINSHGGAIITYLGDGIMVTFGAARPSETYAADALRCAESLADGVGDWAKSRQTPDMGIGIDVGQVVCGTVGQEGKLEYAVLGDPVNRAAKIQVHTKQVGVQTLASRFALEQAKAQGYDGQRYRVLDAPQQVAGIDGTLELVTIQ
ncbi:MAG: adenylate/guanylate cyclase domain-containing protein [Burkholderiaceae bacterium]